MRFRLPFEIHPSVVAAYVSPGREYHTVQHLKEMFCLFPDDALTPETIAATYFHDVVIRSYVKTNGCVGFIRGIRNSKDFEYEQKITDFNLEHNGLSTLFFPCPEHLRHISSSKIRENKGP